MEISEGHASRGAHHELMPLDPVVEFHDSSDSNDILAGKSHDSDGDSDGWTGERSDWAFGDGSGEEGDIPDLMDDACCCGGSCPPYPASECAGKSLSYLFGGVFC